MKAAVPLLFIVCRVLTLDHGFDKTHNCRPQCSQGLQCRDKLHSSFAPCTRRPKLLNSTIVHGVSVTTVMECEGKQRCSLRLKVTSSVQINEHLQGVSVCVMTAGMLERCREVHFHRKSRDRLTGQQVEVQNGCFEVGPGQDVHVTLKTVPNYCDVAWSQRYHVQGCHSGDLRNNLPECITGKISYTVDTDRRELSVRISDMLEDRNYHLRLCHLWNACAGTGAYTQFKKEEPLKEATLSYSRALPCLCIEGWSAMVDALRVQACPFRNRTEELWAGVTFDPEEEALSWEQACPVEVVTTLCRREGENTCLDLVNSSRTPLMRKVRYTRVDPNPKLCMKFTTEAGSWIKCPFEDRNFQAWDLTLGSGAGWRQAIVTAQIRAQLSLRLCQNSEPSNCDDIISIPTEKHGSVAVNLTMDMCASNTCILMQRTDVQFSIPVLRCDIRCSDGRRLEDIGDRWDVEAMLVLAVGCLALVMAAVFIGNLVLSVYHRRQIGVQLFQKDTAQTKSTLA
ncbi:hypothetical protein AAFF_G00172980 [Aldrovandia affinis]|uniref:Interleukin-17 receptor C/E N-terminal domain-containing protein n=1 Tax=Aldrovandia affinis TaxID=143900 RepID=A0AAD7T027_9TELE|nr:hypothetical protein AAFF_G00172980 [Aldrovandia affinis]